MSCGYLYEIRRKSQEYEESSEKTQPLRANLRTFSEEEEDEIWEVPEESFDNVYQNIIENEDDSDDIVENGLTAESDKKLKLRGNSSNVLQNFEFFSAQRLRLSLSAEQISLKSQQQQWENPQKSATQQREIINKSINTEADVVTKPLAVNSDSSSAASDTTTAIGTCHNGTNSNAVKWKTVKINNKCEQNENTTPTTTTTTTCSSKYPLIYLAENSRKKPQTEYEIIQNMTDIQINGDPTVIRKQSKTIKPPAEKQKLQSNFRKFSLESFSVKRPHRIDDRTLAQVECCVSPESIVDNILSNASSTSVQSSSLSSSILTDDSEDPKAGGSNNSFNIGKKVLVVEDTAKSPTFDQKLSNESRAPFNLPFPIEKLRQPVIRVTHASSSSSSTINNLALSVTSSESYETASTISRHPSLPTSDALVIHATTPTDQPPYPAELLCQICGEIFKDPRCLNCLHTFCLQCIVDENIKGYACNPFWPLLPNNNGSSSGQRQQKIIQIEENLKAPELKADSTTSDLLTSTAAPQKPRSSFSFKLKRSIDNSPTKTKSDINKPVTDITTSPNHVQQQQQSNLMRKIVCKICQYTTEVPTGGLRQLPQNLLLQRKIDAFHFKMTDAGSFCSLCYEQTDATYHCKTCTLNLCTLCKESHARQKTTATHNIKQIVEVETEQSAPAHIGKYKLKCNLHQDFDVKSFCINCLQVACTDCLILHHKGHKYEAIAKANQCYARLLRDSTEQSRSVCKCTENSLNMLNEFSDTINRKCDELQADVEDFMGRYLEAVEAHKQHLLQQINRARETKMTIIAEKQVELEKRSMEAMTATTFSDELTDIGSGVEILSFVKIILKRFEHCQQFQISVDPKITNVPNFLPKIQAPPGKDYNDIPVFGIITTQTVEPSQCTLQWDGFSQLRLHKKVELTLISRDADGLLINHGGLKIQSHVKYKDVNSKCLRMEVTDNSDGTYNIAFTPDTEGTIILMITINYKHIKGSPFSFLARTVRPHTGIYHCCTFCSSKGNKFTTCSCDGHMPGYSGCGHGHTGHPGHRHWSCCGDILRNSECHFSNRSLNPK